MPLSVIQSNIQSKTLSLSKRDLSEFTMACEDLQLSSPKTNTSTTPPGNNGRENRASPLEVGPSQSTKIVLSPQPHTTKTTLLCTRQSKP